MKPDKKQTKIVLASILKPLDDVRHFEKLGRSLAKKPNTEVYILGRDITHPLPETNSNIHFYAICPSQPNLLDRLLSSRKLFLFLIKVKPQQVIACTHELLTVIILNKIIFGTKTVYELRENYAENIRSNSRFNPFIKKLLAGYIRTKETICSPLIDQFWLAEACYEQELPFVKGKSVVLENKSLFFRFRQEITLSSNQNIILLFSGTIAQENGIFEAIALASSLHQIDNRYQLFIVGCCHQPNTAKQLQELALLHKDFITLIFNSIPLKNSLILENVVKADIGLICYRPQNNFKNKLPTKLFEYTAAGLPILLQINPKWETFCGKFNNAISTDFQNFNPTEIDNLIKTKVFYPHGNSEAKEYTWAVEENKLLNS